MALCAGGSAPNITAFVLPALSCQSVRAALLRPAQVLGSYIASASQMLVSALVRRYGLGSLAHRAGSAIACGSAYAVLFVPLWHTPATATRFAFT